MAAPIPVMLMVRELGIGGCERDVAKLAKAIDRSRFCPHVGCFSPEGLRTDELRRAGIPIVSFPVTSFLSLSVIAGVRQMRRYLKEHRIQVVHCFDTPTVIFGIPTARSAGVPAVISAQLGERELFDRKTHRLLRWTDGLADVVVANSRSIQEYLIEKESIPRDRTYLCHNGVETDIFHPTSGPKHELVADASLVIGTVCALRPEKRVDLLLKAFAEARNLQDGMKLLVVGSGPMLPQLEALRDKLGLGKDCIFQPATSNVPSWMRNLDIYVMSSETESFPNALLEAMACGCSVVGSRVGGVPELITDGVSGLLFESLSAESLATALAKLVRDPALRRQLAAQAAISARSTFSMEVNVKRNQELYRTVLSSKGVLTAA